MKIFLKPSCVENSPATGVRATESEGVQKQGGKKESWRVRENECARPRKRQFVHAPARLHAPSADVDTHTHTDMDIDSDTDTYRHRKKFPAQKC